jgi:diguanylate cyclase (GGDEF)-like protein
MRRKPATDPVIFRQSLLQLLEVNHPKEDQLLSQFERQRDEGHPVYSSILYILTHLSFSEGEARKHWEKILAHRTRLKAELRRDVGLRVSILDYFVNLNQALKNPKVIELAIYERTERSAVTDGLTGLFNHAYFLQALRREIQRAKRHNLQVSLLLFDLDNFKKLNDTRGHLEGDKVLIKTAALVKENLREMDVPARYGGEEFAVILPDTPRTGAFVVADRIRRHIEQRFKRSRKSAAVTISGGVACFPEDAATPEELIQKADQGLYRSKAEGKNRITLIDGERRRHLRVAVNHRVTLEGEGAAAKLSARAKNVSESGLLVSLKEPVPVGSQLNVVIHPHGGVPLGMHGQVVRVTPGGEHEQGVFDVGVKLNGDGSKNLLVVGRGGNA